MLTFDPREFRKVCGMVPLEKTNTLINVSFDDLFFAWDEVIVIVS